MEGHQIIVINDFLVQNTKKNERCWLIAYEVRISKKRLCTPILHICNTALNVNAERLKISRIDSVTCKKYSRDYILDNALWSFGLVELNLQSFTVKANILYTARQ